MDSLPQRGGKHALDGEQKLLPKVCPSPKPQIHHRFDRRTQSQ